MNMKNIEKRFEYKQRRYDVRAKRKNTDERWSEWTVTNDYEKAVNHAKQVEKVGYESKIFDKGVRRI